jgi:glycosyltransferase involved in cell wall biosynthesis
MKILILTTITPFLSGGAEAHARNLRIACESAGHQVDTIALPFNYNSPGDIGRALFLAETENLEALDCGAVDLVVCLKFPAYCVSHPRKVVWLLHQHRPAYDLWDPATADDHAIWLRRRIHESDRRHLAPLEGRLFTNSANVSRRLKASLGIEAPPLHHPPPILPSNPALTSEQPYIFLPSRLEAHKRQDLLIAALAQVKAPVRAVIAGSGGQAQHLAALVSDLRLQERVTLTGTLSDEAIAAHYAGALAVFYGPKDEDYGYVTLEAMLHRRPVITTGDAGGPLEFITDGVEGLVVAPEPTAIAAAIDTLATQPAMAARLGARGFESFLRRRITWPNVVDTLIGAVAAA